MKRRTTLIVFGMVISVLLVQLLAGTQPARAYFDCESDLWEAFMNANSTYTTTFHSWYLGQPESCLQICEDKCATVWGPEHQTCLSNCPFKSCVNERYHAFLDAQDALTLAVSHTCTFNPDVCDQARYNRDQCVATYNLEWQYPLLDGDGNVDAAWSNTVSNEFFSCMSASGIMGCE